MAGGGRTAIIAARHAHSLRSVVSVNTGGVERVQFLRLGYGC
jgi:hypothetical protein